MIDGSSWMKRYLNEVLDNKKNNFSELHTTHVAKQQSKICLRKFSLFKIAVQSSSDVPMALVSTSKIFATQTPALIIVVHTWKQLTGYETVAPF